MKQLVSINLTTRTANDWTPPELYFGETLTLAMRFYKNSEGNEIDAALDVSSLKASIGEVDARPAGGQFAIKIGSAPSSGDNTTTALEHNTSASNLAEKLNALAAHAAYGDARVVATDESWLIFFGDQSEQVPMAAVNNGLWPVSFGRITAWQVDGKWVHELRLTQAPVAFTDASDTTLPQAPEITRIQEGGSDQSGTYFWNEIQQLYISPEFRGSYIIKRGYGKTTPLSREDGIDTIQEALQVLGADCWKVTLPLSNKPTIEFIGDYSGQRQDLLLTQVDQAPAEDLAFTLALDRAELAAMLRRKESVTLPLEIRISGTDDSGFAGQLVALTLDVTIKRPVIFPDMAAVPGVDWLFQSPKDYVPFTPDQVVTGPQAYAAVIGTGAATTIEVTHGLATSNIANILVRSNTAAWTLLAEGTDYTATISSDDVVTLVFGEAPALNSLIVYVTAAAVTRDWEPHTHTVPQIVAGGGYPSLPDFMDDIGSRVTILEAILPSTGPGATAAQASGITIALPDTKEILFFKGAASELKAVFGAAENPGADATKLGRAPLLLPAVHDATLTDYEDEDLPDMPAVAADTVWTNISSATLNMGRGIYGGNVAHDGFFASDGRVLYAVDHSGSTTSYFPTGFDRELFRIFINDKMLRLNRTLDVQFGLALQLLNATSNAQWMLVIEHGAAPSQSEPATTALNLENIEWETDPLLSQRLILTGNRQTHSFGARIKRSLVDLTDTITADTLLYGVWEGADALAPAGANFALRARLIQFDTENALAADARGWIACEIIGAKEGEKPQATII